MRWIGRLFDERDTLVRLVLLDLSGLCYLVLRPTDGPQPTTPQWALAGTAFGAALVLHRRPLGNLLVQTALLAVALWTVQDPLINQVGSSWALLELTMLLRRPAALWPPIALLSGLYLTHTALHSPKELGRMLFGLTVVVGLPVLLGLNVRSARVFARQAEEHAAEEQRRREYESRAARAEERGTIARELHDVVAHHVASMVLRVAVARHVLPDADPRVTEVFDDVHATGTTALTELRGLVALLRDPDGVRSDAALTAIEPAALPAALCAVADRAQRAGLSVEVDVAPQVGALDAVRGLAVLRLTQEALTNVAKHAGPSAHARLSVAVHDGEVHWQVVDDGDPQGGAPQGGAPQGGDPQGGDPQGGGAPADGPIARPPTGGHGLTGMRERVEVLGGHLQAGPSGAGWRVSTVLPARPVALEAPS